MYNLPASDFIPCPVPRRIHRRDSMRRSPRGAGSNSESRVRLY